MNYIIDHIPMHTDHDRRPGLYMEPDTITIHNTGNPKSNARGERGWLTNPSNDRTASYHIVVDDKEAIECLPLDENAWHAGDGVNGRGNRKSISIEICESGDYAQAVENAVQLVAKMLKGRGWGVDRLRRHYDWSGKICPRLMYDGGTWRTWHEFKQRVAAELKKGEEDMELSTWQNSMLVDALRDLREKMIINDDSWIKKAEKGELTLSELTWLNTIIITRKL